MFGRKKKEAGSYDPAEWKPVLRCSICTGEQVAGFMNLDTRVFREECLIRNEGELQEFKRKYRIEDEIEKIY